MQRATNQAGGVAPTPGHLAGIEPDELIVDNFAGGGGASTAEARIRADAMKSEDVRVATEALAWAEALETEIDNDYLWNLRVLANSDAIEIRQAGLAASMISAYCRAIEREINRAREAEANKDSEYIGTVGARIELDLTLVSTKHFDNDFGGTVKDHAEYQGIKETVVNRMQEFDPEAAALAKAAAKVAAKARAKGRRNAPPPEATPSPACATNGQFEAQEVVV
jgi:hypothetical protein